MIFILWFLFLFLKNMSRRSKDHRKSVFIATRVTPKINELVKLSAESDGLYVSEWLRKVIENELSAKNLLELNLIKNCDENLGESNNI